MSNVFEKRKMSNGGWLKSVKYNAPLLDLVPEMPGVYVIRCLDTDRCYIGSALNIKKKLKMHFNSINRPSERGIGSCFSSGRFLFEVLDIGDISAISLKVLESHYISSMNTKFPNGFNKKDPMTGRYYPEVFDLLYNKKIQPKK